MTHRFFLTTTPIQVNQTVDLMPLQRQLRSVLRLTPGALIILLDNQGTEYDVEIVELQAKSVRGTVLTRRANRAEPTIHLTLYQCSLKADKFEWVLQKGTELGVSTFVPVISERSIVRPAAALLKKYDRWQAIIREAAEQCGRGRLPTLLEPHSWSTAVVHAQGARLMPWESVTTEASLLHTITQQLALSTTDSMAENTPTHSNTQVSLIIGPEGGIADAEAANAQENSWQCVSLGPRILRAETAALAAVTIIMAANESSHPMTYPKISAVGSTPNPGPSGK